MTGFRFVIAVVVTSLALVVALVGTGALLVGNALASGAWFGPHGAGPWFGSHGFGPDFALPPELSSLLALPPSQRFAHFMGVQVSLTDKDNKAFTITVTPGTATAVGATSLTITANDGSTETFALDDKTMIRGKAGRDGTSTTGPALAAGDRVVVVELNNSATASAVMRIGPEGFGPHGPRGPFRPGR